MSNNKYIIDKDSLTGIADAVRDKLGTGEATTDSQTGDIIYPEDKGYYLKYTHPVQWTKGTMTDTWSGTRTDYVRLSDITEEQLLRVCNGVRPVYVKIDAVPTSGNDGISVENSLTNWSTSNHIVTLPTSGRFYCQYFYYHSSYYSGRYFQKTIPETTFSFLDENQEIIVSEDASYIDDDSYSRKNLPQESTSVLIPFSIDDIQDKITNYLTRGGTLETWKLSDTDGTYSITFPSGFSVENLKDITCVSNGYPRGLYKDSSGKPVSMKDQGISLPSSFSTIGSPLTVAKISTAHSEGRTFCIPWDWTGTKTIPDNTFFVWFIIEPNDSKIYLGIGRYANYVSNGKWTVIYT